jgi:hypothetical protein
MPILFRPRSAIAKTAKDCTVSLSSVMDEYWADSQGAPFQHAAVFKKEMVRLDSDPEWLGFLR